MKSIRARLLSWLLPPLLALVVMISLFFYYSQSDEIASHYRHHLETIVKMAALLMPEEDVAYLVTHKNDPHLQNEKSFLRLYTLLSDIKQKVPVQSLFIIVIEKVAVGESVIKEKPTGKDNPSNTSENSPFSLRQLYLVDTALKESGHTDFSESGEEEIYQNKKPFVTPLYTSRSSLNPTLTGYAPIFSPEGQVIALMGADLDLTFFESSLHEALIVILIAALVTIGLMILSSLLVALKITSPVHKLNDAALVLAAGDFAEPIKVEGPQEIAELATTLNTLREYLIDNVARLSDLNLSKEKLYGENECQELLNFYMVEEVLQKKTAPFLRSKEVRLPKSPSHALWLTMEEKGDLLEVTLKEAFDFGFLGAFALLSRNKGETLTLTLHKSGKIHILENKELPVLLWSTLRERFVSPTDLQVSDYLIFLNRGVRKQMPSEKLLTEWLGKTLRHFAKEGLELTSNMIASELKFFAKKNFHHEDIRFIIFQRIK